MVDLKLTHQHEDHKREQQFQLIYSVACLVDLTYNIYYDNQKQSKKDHSALKKKIQNYIMRIDSTNIKQRPIISIETMPEYWRICYTKQCIHPHGCSSTECNILAHHIHQLRKLRIIINHTLANDKQ